MSSVTNNHVDERLVTEHDLQHTLCASPNRNIEPAYTRLENYRVHLSQRLACPVETI